MTRYDCTHPIESGMPVYPGDPAVSVEPAATQERDGYRVSELRLGTHAGTHVDAPSHTEPDGKTLGAYPVERFRFDARVVDVRGYGAREAIPPSAVPETDADGLLFHTGWDEHWGTERYVDHPYLAPATARRCADEDFDVGLDTLNPDPTEPRGEEPEGVPAHRALLGNECLVVENLRGLARLPECVTFSVYPLAVDADGAPVRAVAET